MFAERRAPRDLARAKRHGDNLIEWTNTMPRRTRSSESSSQVMRRSNASSLDKNPSN